MDLKYIMKKLKELSFEDRSLSSVLSPLLFDSFYHIFRQAAANNFVANKFVGNPVYKKNLQMLISATRGLLLKNAVPESWKKKSPQLAPCNCHTGKFQKSGGGFGCFMGIFWLTIFKNNYILTI